VANPTSRAFASKLTSRFARRTAIAGLGSALILGLATPAFADSGNTAPKPAAAVQVAPAAPAANASAAKASAAKAPAHKTPAAKAPAHKAVKVAAKSSAPTTAQLMTHGKPHYQASIPLSASQKANAAAITKAAQEMKLPARAAVIAVATALQESALHNYGNLGSSNDHDSLGLFQQRPSAGWGSPSQCEQPDHAAKSFLSRLVHVRNWDKMQLTNAAQAVQVSAYGDRYAKWESQAAGLVASTFRN
jgi:hypothetical protein